MGAKDYIPGAEVLDEENKEGDGEDGRNLVLLVKMHEAVRQKICCIITLCGELNSCFIFSVGRVGKCK